MKIELLGSFFLAWDFFCCFIKDISPFFACHGVNCFADLYLFEKGSYW
ncbi:hypothetical protein DHBDCA_p1027 [Dehalobacter sp. DCA]|jgi:hypothetical protein|nr:hypothetical protein DHBDCA_p1027 [Dehalobacter sp. DCA]AFV05088.1 hypothetical protein DCF50_p1083 [Dehalobacter sp. CF]